MNHIMVSLPDYYNSLLQQTIIDRVPYKQKLAASWYSNSSCSDKPIFSSYAKS